MNRVVIYNIGKLVGILPAEVRKLEGEAMGQVECIDDAYLIIEDGIISEFGHCAKGGSIGCENNPSHTVGAGPSPCGQGGSTVFTTDASASEQNTEYLDA